MSDKFDVCKYFNNPTQSHIRTCITLNDCAYFDSIRDEPEFQQIVSDIGTKYQAEHEKVRKWLEENDM